MSTLDAIRPDLERVMPGAVYHPDHPDYDEMRRTFNGTIDRRPALIVQPTTTEGVAEAVRAARTAGLGVAIRGGGHGVAGTSVADGALVVDLRRMRGVVVDPAARRARAAGGAVWEDVDRATMVHDLAVTGGTFWDTGIAGLTLGGGLGFLMGSSGLTCDNLMRATVVTADGAVVDAGPDGDPELLWALRGGGGNFGVVTEFEYHLDPLGDLFVALCMIPLDIAAAALQRLDAYVAEAPDEVVVFLVGPTPAVLPAPGEAPAGPLDHLRVIVVVRAPLATAEAAVAPIFAIPGVSGSLEPVGYEDVQGGELMPFGLRHYWKGHFVGRLDAAACDLIVSTMRAIPHPSSFVLLEALSGQARREPEGGAAFGQRGAHWNASALGIWEDPAEDATLIGWARAFADGIGRISHSGAGYGNYASPDETPERVRAAFDAERYGRLQAVKRRYDPDNVFRFNLNIPPD
jgi:FAD/FMN-containing dehydrogenase